MMRIKLYLGSQELEKYLNKKVQHNYILETIIPFGLFQPLRLDVLKFKKKKDLQRIYIVDSNDLVLIKRKYQNLGWQYFENNYAIDEFNNDAIFYYDSIDENYENVSNRMMGNQKLVEKFVRKFLDDPTYDQIKEAVAKMDYDEILRTTHTMKEIASNLEFTYLQQKSAKAVDMIRAGQQEEVLPVIDEIEKEYQKVVDGIQKLD